MGDLSRTIAVILNGVLLILGLILIIRDPYDPDDPSALLLRILLILAPASALGQMRRRPK